MDSKENYCQCDNIQNQNYTNSINISSKNTVVKPKIIPCNVNIGSPGFSNIGVL